MERSDSKFPRMHVSLYVKNLAATVNFYNTFFGVPADKIRDKYAKYILKNPSLVISFIENPERVQSNFGHLGFQVETKQEMEEKLELAKSKDIVSKEEIGTACCYAIQDKFWVNDPDGVQWEVYYFHEDVEFNDPHYESTEATACCTPAEEEKEKPQKSLIITDEMCVPGTSCC
ncbi:MAG: catechol 2,3-dioxygenase-like lactoylglutathione lyase family enzyme [Cyclobacteriaceae bacterium]|jgi:catechol 2,3-dioxygenase-like lactoylglutathione lyase family enzyme